VAKVKLNPALQQVRGTVGRVRLPGSIWRADHLEAAGYVEGDMERGAGGASPAGSGGRWRMHRLHWQMKRRAPCMRRKPHKKGSVLSIWRFSDYFKGRNILAGGE